MSSLGNPPHQERATPYFRAPSYYDFTTQAQQQAPQGSTLQQGTVSAADAQQAPSPAAGTLASPILGPYSAQAIAPTISSGLTMNDQTALQKKLAAAGGMNVSAT